jgi:hypothetical protein
MSVFDIDTFLAGLLASQVFIHGARMERATLFYDDYAINDAKIETITAFVIFFIFGMLGCLFRRVGFVRVMKYATWAALAVWVVSTAGVGYSFNPTDVRNNLVAAPLSMTERITILVCKHTTAGFFFFPTLVDAFSFPPSALKIILMSIMLPVQAIFWSGALSFGSGGYIYVDRMGFVCGVVACVVRFLLVNAPGDTQQDSTPSPTHHQKVNTAFLACGLLHAVITWIFLSFAFIPLLPFQGTDIPTHFWGFFIGTLAVVSVPGPSYRDICAIVAMVVITVLCATGTVGFFWGASTGTIWTWLVIQPARKQSVVRCEEWMAVMCAAAALGSVTQFGLLLSGKTIGDFVITIMSTTMLVCTVALCSVYMALGWTGFWGY